MPKKTRTAAAKKKPATKKRRPAAPKAARPSAPQAMLSLITGYWVSQMLFVVANLGVADLLAKRPLTAEEIGAKVGANAAFLHRVLRALASVGVFAEISGGRFRLTPLAQTLRTDAPGSLRNFARMMVDDYNYNTWGSLGTGVATGETPFHRVFGQRFFPYLAAHPEQERTFAASMASISATENEAIARAYPFGKLGRLVDVGGAHGHLLATILRRHRKLRGVLYDQPSVVAKAEISGFVTAPEVRGRCEVVGGDFFASVPADADAYIMKYILHDWEDEKSLQILTNCRALMARGGRVLVVEHVIPPGNDANWGKLLDINMLVLTGGEERTQVQFRDLFARAGLKLERVVPTASPLSILEAVAA